MPNTLVHLGIQGLGSRLISDRIDLKWVFLGCMIPDIPWILRHVILALDLSIDAYDLRLYTLVQASLLFCLVLSAIFALLSERPRLVFIILAVNSLVHLLLDAVEIKWGNGVHLFAPFDWQIFSFGLVWTDSLLVTTLSIVGLLFGIWTLTHPSALPVHIQLNGKQRLVSILIVASVYFFGPLGLLDGPYSTDTNSIATLKETEHRIGKEIRMDRETYRRGDEGDKVLTFTREPLNVIGEIRAHDHAKVSLIGVFIDRDVIQVQQFHEHRPLWRDLASYLGLGIIALTWLIAFARQARNR